MNRAKSVVSFGRILTKMNELLTAGLIELPIEPNLPPGLHSRTKQLYGPDWSKSTAACPYCRKSWHQDLPVDEILKYHPHLREAITVALLSGV